MRTNEAIAGLGALAQQTRLSVFRLLVRVGPVGLAAGSLAERVEVPATSLSFHLHALLQAGLVRQERQGRQLIYSANYARMDALIGFLTENCCGLAARRPTQNLQRDRHRRAS